MTKEEAIEALKALLEPGEVVHVCGKRKGLGSLSPLDLELIYLETPGVREGVLAAVKADRKREVARMREAGFHWEVVQQIAEFLGVEVE